MDFNKNYYQILGINKNCDDDTIKKSFRNLSKMYHPDKGGDVNKFKEINEANSILSDPLKKEKYDISSPHGKNYNNNVNNFYSNFGFDIDDFLRRSGFQREMLDIELDLNITLSEIYNNEEKTINYLRNVPCDACNGNGEVDMNGYVVCHHCDGKGCENCNHTGKITKKVCESCSGTKLKLKNQTIPINNLYVLSDTSRTIVYDNYGNYSKITSNRVGRLCLNLIPILDDNYKKIGKDLYFKIFLDFKIAILGGNIEYHHLDGKTYSIKIPEKTNNNARFKLRGKGLLINNNSIRGDLFLDVELMIDYSKIDENALNIIKQL